MGALEKVAERAAELDRQWQQRLEAARYEAERAARRYYAVEPENRLVVRTLESEWNERLEEVERLEREYGAVKQRPPLTMSPQQRQKILALSQDLPRLWHAPTTKNSQKKQVLRLLIEDVTLRRQEESGNIEVAIQWKTGVVSRHYTSHRERVHPRTTAPETVTRLRELLSEKTDAEIASILDREGHHTGCGQRFTAKRVENLRRHRGLKHPR